jgi:hypothetical protein
MSKESFARGFAKKAAEHGIDPESLAKIAAEEGYSKEDLEEYARHIGYPKNMNGSLRDVVNITAGPAILGMATSAGSALSGSDAGMKPSLARAAGSFANLVGMIAAAITKRRTIKEQIEADKRNRFVNLIPGIAGYEMAKRMGVNYRYAKGVKEKGGKKVNEKKAEEGQYGLGGVNWGNITNWLSEQKKKYYDNADDATKALIGAGGGALGGALLSKIVGGSGMGGAALGALAGGAASVDWKKISDELGKMQAKKTPSGTAPAAAAK